MAEKCICCGKKIGLLSGSHINNQVCDSCYYPIAGFWSSIKESYDLQIIEDDFNYLIQKVESSSYSENGKEFLIKMATDLVENKKDDINTISKIEHIRNNFKVTTSYNFEGYKISKYYGIASGSTVLGTGFLSEGRAAVSDVFGIESDSFADKLEQARNSSIKKMIDEAIKQGGNALIGVSFDYINFSSNMIGVVANGTVVEITEEEK